MDAARALFLAGDLDGALAAYDRAIAENPADAAAHAGRAALLFYRGDLAASHAGAEKAIGLDPGCSEAHLVRARLLEPNNRLQAIAEASRAIDADPSNTPALSFRAVWRAATGDAAGAVNDLQMATGIAAPDPYRVQIRGQAHAGLREYAKALLDFDAAIAGGVTLPFAYYARAEARSRLKDHKGAIEDFTRILERTPGDAGMHVERGRERACENDLEGARADFERAIELDPNQIPAFYHRAWVRAANDPEAAKVDYARAAVMPASTADGFYFRGLAQEALGRRESAAEDFARAREAAPYNHPRRPEIEERAKAVPHKRAVRKEGEVQDHAWATWMILVANIAVWVAQGDLGKTPDGETLVHRGALWGPLVLRGEYWRLFTAMFLHVGAFHLFWNLYGGYSACASIEKLIGSSRFLIGYVLSGFGASAVSLIGHTVAAAGASGALFGVLGMVLVAYYVKLGNFYFFFSHPRVKSLLKGIGIWFVLGIVALPMDNYAHFGGLVFGLLFGLLFMKASSWGIPRRLSA
jgi:membrane associated rhomboid family serine protease/Tfp pilus assembly protein PilF